MKLFTSKTVAYLTTFLVTLTTVLVTLAVVPPQTVFGGDVDADKACAEGKEDKYEVIAAQGNAIDNLLDCYHQTVNKIFNANIREMVKLAKTGKEEDLKKLLERVAPFKPDENGNRSCKANPDNISTYCVSEKSVIEYGKFRAGMLKVREHLKADAGAEAARIQKMYVAEQEDMDNFFGNGDAGEAQRNIFSTFGAKLERIDNELAVARTSLDQALAAYHELQFALPMHVKYKQVIKTISGDDGYIEQLSDIRRRTEYLPGEFIDVTTPACN